MVAESSDWLAPERAVLAAALRSGERKASTSSLSSEMAIGEAWRAGLDVGGGFLDSAAGRGLAVRGFSASSSSESESPACAPPFSLSSSLASRSDDFRFAGIGRFVGLAVAVDASDSVVGIRGTFEGRCGLKGGALRLEAAYTTFSLGSLRGGILFIVVVVV